MRRVTIKLHRENDRIGGVYGRAFEAKLDELRRQSPKSPVIKIPGSKISVIPHEDGSDIIGALPELMKYVGYIADLAAVWLLARGLVRREKRTLRISVGEHSYEGIPKDKKEARKILKSFLDLYS